MLWVDPEALRRKGRDEGMKRIWIMIVHTNDEGMNKVKLKWNRMTEGWSEKKMMKECTNLLVRGDNASVDTQLAQKLTIIIRG